MADEKGKEKVRSIDNAAITLIEKAQKENDKHGLLQG